MTTATFAAVLRRSLLRLALDAKSRGLTETETAASLGDYVEREHRAARRAALKRGVNPIDYLARSERTLEITAEVLGDVMVEVYGACSC